MECENILLFQPVRTTWHFFCEMREKPLISVSSTDRTIKKAVAWLTNGIKSRIAEVAIVISTIFSVLYSLITYPIRWHNSIKQEKIAIQKDIDRYSPEELKEVNQLLEAYFKKHEDIFKTLTKSQKEEIAKKVISQCARSEKVYGPVVRLWVDNLLAQANRDCKKIVFMARDGIPFYKVALELMKTPEYQKKYPNLVHDQALTLGHFSRNVVSSSSGSAEGQELFQRYVRDELGIQDGDRCIFADIGFSGSMVKPIRSLMPSVSIDFKFLVATSDKAEGFLGNPQNPLPCIESAANNLGVRWVEESHHGSLASATKLVEGEDHHIYPDTHYPKKVRCEEKFSTPYLIRKFCLKRVVQSAVNRDPLKTLEGLVAKSEFNSTIGKIKTLELPLFVGWDY